MKKAGKIIQILLGAGLVFVGVNKFAVLFEPPVTEGMNAWMEAIKSTGFLFELIAIFQVATGLLFLVNKWVPIASLIILPIMSVAFLSHLFLDVPGIGGATFFLAMIIFVMFGKRESFKILFE